MSAEKIFIETVDRLKLVLELATDLELAERLGLAKNAFNNRKKRGSLPIDRIDKVIQEEQLNPEFIYEGTGHVHAPVEGKPWGDTFVETLAAQLTEQNQGWLVREGHDAKVLKNVLKGKEQPSMPLLRDLHRVLQVDLNGLFNDEPALAPDGQEQALLMAYRAAPTTGKAFIRHAAGLAGGIADKPATNTIRQRASGSGSSIQIGGSVDGSSKIINGGKDGVSTTKASGKRPARSSGTGR